MRLLVLIAICTGCNHPESWTKDQVISAYDSNRPGIWCPKEIANNRFVVITWDGKYLKPQ